jgi:lipopolysaccharide heptosyltransferase II
MFLTKAVDMPDEEVHKVEYFLDLARAYGIAVKDIDYEFFIKDPHRQKIKAFLKSEGISESDALAVLCPGGNWDMKRWPKENFASLADMLIEKLGVKVVLSGAQKDMALVEGIRGMMKNRCSASCGRTTLKELGALLEKASLVVANDTGPMHLAVAMKSKTIALFGPTSPKLTGPYGGGNYTVIWKTQRCDVPCYDVTCADNSCMRQITVDDVFSKAQEMLKK